LFGSKALQDTIGKRNITFCSKRIILNKSSYWSTSITTS